MSYIYTL
jgi:hypothetical protein